MMTSSSPSSFLIKDVRIFTGSAEIPNGSVLVKDGKISQVSSSQLDPPDSSVQVISKPGHTLLPGLIDGHIHADGGNEIALPQSLRFGVTTVCDMHNEIGNVTKLRKQAEDASTCADIKTCGISATVKGGWPAAVVLLHDKSEEVTMHYQQSLCDYTNPHQTAKAIATWPDVQTEADAAQYIKDLWRTRLTISN